jgi:hypothetical protein|tara:strand:+ start:922 stop:1170 length:249 start_codon:yes stop_codon:yes gene_type:complete
MAYVTSIGLRPTVITNNGVESITFQETSCTFKEEDVNFATEYFNPVTGSFNTNISTLYFESGEILDIKQSYSITSAQLIALN